MGGSEKMTTARTVICTVAFIMFIHHGWAKEGPFYGTVIDRPSFKYGVYNRYGGFHGSEPQNNYSTQNPVVPNLFQRSMQFNSQSSRNIQNYHEACSKYQEYQTLLQLKDNHSCLRATDVWPLLELLSEHDQDLAPQCRVHLIDQLSAAFGHIYLNPDYCTCNGQVIMPKFPNLEIANFLICYNDLNTISKYHYQLLYNEYYSGQYDARRQCTHHHIWNPLSQIQHSGNHYYCQRNLIINLAYTFNNYNPAFHCNTVVSSIHSTEPVKTTLHATTTAVSTTSLPTTVTTTVYMTSTTPPIAIQSCDKYGTITNIAHGIVVSHPSAGDCIHGDHRGSEALLFNLCHTNGAQNWTKGPAVMDDCANIPLYAPVATFFHGSFSSNGGQAGIFLGCLSNGFKLAVQECFANTTVLHIEKGGHLLRDPDIYSVVLF